MNYPTPDETLLLLQQWHDQHTALKTLWGGFDAALGGSPDGPLFSTMWRLFDAYTNVLADRVGAGDWLGWFGTENEMGASRLEAGYDQDLRPIATLADLYRLIAENRKREAKP